MIVSFADAGTKDLFNGVDSKAARGVCQKNTWSIARRKLEELDARLAELRRHRADLARTLADWDERGEEENGLCGAAH